MLIDKYLFISKDRKMFYTWFYWVTLSPRVTSKITAITQSFLFLYYLYSFSLPQKITMLLTYLYLPCRCISFHLGYLSGRLISCLKNKSLSSLSTYYLTAGIENIKGGTSFSGFIKATCPVTFTLFHFVTFEGLLRQDNLAVNSFTPSVIRW